MNLLKKIFPISAKFTGSTKSFVLGLLIYFALSLVTVPLVFIPVIGMVITYYILIGTVVTILLQFGAFNEDDTPVDILKQIFPFSYKLTDTKQNFVVAIIGYAAAILMTPLVAYSVIGLILLIVDYCKKNKAAKADEETAAPVDAE